ncbi:1744_t:CDS:2 [Paraglomus brasilianum]|uniref:1744_t:CDS:1 n=1 Tax=Paraglomus brasilianum TaxID=144538 RepID=A0A9N9DLQ7_9GLOM|nr:1744_t:CDS:2 [Paraglomus brasilianum]
MAIGISLAVSNARYALSSVPSDSGVAAQSCKVSEPLTKHPIKDRTMELVGRKSRNREVATTDQSQ